MEEGDGRWRKDPYLGAWQRRKTGPPWGRWRRGGSGVAVQCGAETAVDFPSLAAPPSRSARVRSGWRLGSEPRGLSPWPPLPLIWHCATGAHQPRWIGCPDQGVVKGSELAVGPIRLRSVLTFSPLISTYHLTLNFDFNCFHFYLFHHKSVYRACLIVTVSRHRFNSYNTHLWSKTDSLTLSPLLSGKHRLYHKPMSTVCYLNTLGGKPW
jgi:hypothetical protein